MNKTGSLEDFAKNISDIATPRNSFQNARIELRYEEDCELLGVCESIGATYNTCYKGSVTGNRCNPNAKQMIQMSIQQDLLQKKRFKITLIIAVVTCILSGIAAICAIIALT